MSEQWYCPQCGPRNNDQITSNGYCCMAPDDHNERVAPMSAVKGLLDHIAALEKAIQQQSILIAGDLDKSIAQANYIALLKTQVAKIHPLLDETWPQQDQYGNTFTNSWRTEMEGCDFW